MNEFERLVRKATTTRGDTILAIIAAPFILAFCLGAIVVVWSLIFWGIGAVMEFLQRAAS